MEQHAHAQKHRRDAAEHGPGEAEQRQEGQGRSGEVEEVEDQEAPGAPFRDPEDQRRGEGNQRRTGDVGSPFPVTRHPHQLEQIETVTGQGEGGREQTHGGVPHWWLEQRVHFRTRMTRNTRENRAQPLFSRMCVTDVSRGMRARVWIRRSDPSSIIHAPTPQIGADSSTRARSIFFTYAFWSWCSAPRADPARTVRARGGCGPRRKAGPRRSRPRRSPSRGDPPPAGGGSSCDT